MRILACFKIVRDVDGLTPAELRALRAGTLDLSVFKQIIGVYDEAALENALRLADAVRAQGGDATLHAATLGDCDARFAADLFALGYERLFHIPRTAPRPETVAAALAALIEARQGYDAVFMGKQAGLDEHGQTPFLVAAMTGLPCVAETRDLRLRRDGGIEVDARTDGGASTRTVSAPAIYAMGEAAHPYLRIATLREKLKAKGRTMEPFDPPPAPSRMGAPRRLVRRYDEAEKTCVFLDGATAAERVDALWDRYLREALP